MINTTNIRRTTLGEFLCLGGPPSDLEPIDFCLFNWGYTNSNPIKMSDNFSYLLTTENNYIDARSRNMASNWSYNYKKPGRKNNLPFMLSKIKALEELNSIKIEHFLAQNHGAASATYSFGIYDDLNCELDYKYNRNNAAPQEIIT